MAGEQGHGEAIICSEHGNISSAREAVVGCAYHTSLNSTSPPSGLPMGLLPARGREHGRAVQQLEDALTGAHSLRPVIMRP